MGRKKIGSHRSYRISDADYNNFLFYCKEKNLKPTQVVRDLVISFTTKRMKEDLKKSKEMNMKWKNIDVDSATKSSPQNMMLTNTWKEKRE